MKNNQTKKKVLALIMSMTIAAGLAGCAADTNMNSSANGETVETYADSADTAVKSEEYIGNENHYETAYEITDWNTADLLNDLTVFGAGFINDGHIAQQEAENSEEYMIESSYSDYLDQTYACIKNKDEKEFTFGFKGDVTDNIYAEKFVYLTIGSNLDGEDNVIPEFNINGVTEKSTNENVKEIFGEPNTIKNSDNSLIYCVNDGQVIFWFNDDGTVKCVQIFLQ